MSLGEIKVKDVNILIVGETGIGKSTWINAVATYLKYDNFKKASKSPLVNLIPTDFTYNPPPQETKDDDDEIEIEHQLIKIGNDENESMEPGKSRTMKPKAHVFEYKGRVVRLIDTPGISDTDGIIQDKKNMQEIVDFISDLTHLNLIVFLMAPNQSRLTPAFTFCFQELIMQFHRSAADNMVFAFTKSAECGFKVGDTFTPLKMLLKNIKEQQGIDMPLKAKTMFAFDNVSYRELCIMNVTGKNLLNKERKKAVAKCFDVSRDELFRLIEHALHVKPHNPQSTAVLNYTRSIILRLVGPMTMISASVQQTLEKIKERESLLTYFNGEEEELKKVLLRPITIVRYRLESKKMVFCKNCATLEAYYDDARLPYITADPEVASQNPLKIWRAKECSKKNGKYYCLDCKGDFKKGKTYRTFYNVQETELKEDQTIGSEIEYVQKNRKDIVQQIAEADIFREEIIQEREVIIKACAKFAAYLKASSILPYNDVTSRYLDTLIDIEEKKKDGCNLEYYRSLCQMKKEYLEEKAILTEGFENIEIDGAISAHDISVLVRQLIALKHYGKDISYALAFVKEHDDSNYNDQASNPRPQTKMWRKLIGTVSDMFTL